MIEQFDLAVLSESKKSIDERRAAQVIALLVTKQSERRSVALQSMQEALGFGHTFDRKQWSRIHTVLRAHQLLHAFDAPLKTAGAWRFRPGTALRLLFNGVPVTPEILEGIADINVPEDIAPDEMSLADRHLKPEVVELMSSAERRFRSGAFDRALTAASELDGLVAWEGAEIFLATKLRKLRILHAIGDRKLLDAELQGLEALCSRVTQDTELQTTLELLVALYGAWGTYHVSRQKPGEAQVLMCANLLDSIRSLLRERVPELKHLKVHIECELKNLESLLRRRLLCDFGGLSGEWVDDRLAWSRAAQTANLEIIEAASLHGELDLLVNYTANQAYLLAMLTRENLITGTRGLETGVRWMAVSDRIAARFALGADNLWSPIYWLVLRRRAAERKCNWLDVVSWLQPVVGRPAKPGPSLPDPTKHANMFSYVASGCTRLLKAQGRYEVPYRIPVEQALLLLEQLAAVREIEGVDFAQSEEVFLKLAQGLALEQRLKTKNDLGRLKDAKDKLVGTKPHIA